MTDVIDQGNLGDYILSAFKLSNLGNVTVSSSQMFQKMMTHAVICFGVSLVFDGRRR